MTQGVIDEKDNQGTNTVPQTPSDGGEFEIRSTVDVPNVHEKTTYEKTVGEVTVKARTIDEVVAITEETPTLKGFIKAKYGLDESMYSANTKSIVNGIADYCAKMAFNVPNTEDTLFQNQSKFYQIIRSALDTDKVSEALMNFDIILFSVYLELDTVFSVRLSGRAVNRLHETIQQPFLNMMTLILATANPATRVKGLKEIDLSKVVASLSSERMKSNLLSFYQNAVS